MSKTLLKAQSPAALAEEYIIKSIWANYFPPGSDLPAERELADKIGVTRTTLREVLQRLARDGWLTIQHGKTTKVNDVWETSGPQILETLIKLDHNIAPLIISNMLSLRTKMSQFYIEEAIRIAPQQAVRLFDDLANLEDTPEAYAEFDYALFRQFTFIANKPVYGLVFNSLKSLYHRIALYYFAQSEGRRVSLKFYQNLKTLCEQANHQDVVNCITQHIQQSGAIWQIVLLNLPEDLNL